MLEKFGNWNLAGNLINNLQNDIENANKITLQRISIFARDKAVGYMQQQNLGWQPLSEAYKEIKIRDGKSNKILIATSSYFQSITAWVWNNNVAIAGVKKTVTNEEGEIIANIAKVHEYGSTVRNIPARPLWKPVYNATVKWIRTEQLFTKVFLERNKRKYNT